MAPPFTVPREGSEARFLHGTHRESNPGPLGGSTLHNHCATPAPTCQIDLMLTYNYHGTRWMLIKTSVHNINVKSKDEEYNEVPHEDKNTCTLAKRTSKLTYWTYVSVNLMNNHVRKK